MKQNRALKVIDRNSLPKVVDILEVPKAKDSKTLNESNKLERSVGNHGSSAISSRQERDRRSMALSKTPKRSNLRRNRNVAKRQLRASNRRPPKPVPVNNSARRNRRSWGSNSFTPYNARTARPQNKKPTKTILTPSLRKSPSILRRYGKLKPMSCRLFNPHNKQHQELEQANRLLGNEKGGASSKQTTTINSTSSFSRVPNVVLTKQPIISLKEKRAGNEASAKKTTNQCKTDNHDDSRSRSSSDDMDCDSSDGLSIDSQSSTLSSPHFENRLNHERSNFPTRKNEINSMLGIEERKESEGKFDNTKKLNDAKKTDSNSPIREQSPQIRKNTIGLLLCTTPASTIEKTRSSDSETETETTPNTSSTTTIEDVVGHNRRSHDIDTELLGCTIGGTNFIQNTDDESAITVFSPSIDQNTTSSVSKGKSYEQNLTPEIRKELNEHQERLSVEAWSIEDYDNSPFFFEIGGKKYGHPALPPGWKMKISKSKNLPMYTHPDHGSTWHCPINLTPNMFYVKTSNGKFVKQSKSISMEPPINLHSDIAKKNQMLKSITTGVHPTPQMTPPSIRNKIADQKETERSVLQSKAIVPVDHLSHQRKDEDPTFELIKDISKLSAGLIKNFSSNIQKAVEARLLNKHKDRQMKDKVSDKKQVKIQQHNQRLFSPRDLNPQRVSTNTNFLHHSDRLINRKYGLNERGTSNSRQDLHAETPSTMSGILQQYEQTVHREQNGSASLGLHSENSRTLCISNRNPTGIFNQKAGTEKLSPIQESTMQSKFGNNDKNVSFLGREQYGEFCNSGMKKNETKGSVSDQSIPIYQKATSKSENKNQITWDVSSNLSSFADPRSSVRKSTSDRIEAWFTPAAKIQKVTKPPGYDNRICSIIDASTPRVCVQEKDTESSFQSSKKRARKHGLQATNVANINSQTLELENRSSPEECQSIPHDDEWSPLAQSHISKHRVHSGEGKYGKLSDLLTKDCHKPRNDNQAEECSSTMTPIIKEAKPINSIEHTNESRDISTNIDCENRSSYDDINLDGYSTDNTLQSTQAMKQSTKSDSELFSGTSDHGQRFDTNSNTVINVTTVAHAQARKKVSYSTIDAYKSVDDRESIASVDTECTETYDGVKDGVTPRQDKNENDTNDTNIKPHVYVESRSTTSSENSLSSVGFSPNADHDDNTTSVCSKPATKEDNAIQLPIKSNDEELGTEYERKTMEEMECSSEELTTNHSENNFDDCSHRSAKTNEMFSDSGSFESNADVSESFRSRMKSPNDQEDALRANKGIASKKGRSRSPGTFYSKNEFSTPLKKDCDIYIDNTGYNDGSSPESPITPTTFEKCDSFCSPRTKDPSLSIEQTAYPTTLEDNSCSYSSPGIKKSCENSNLTTTATRKQRRMSWRVLNPPHPLCTLQRLDSLVLQKKFQKKRPKRRRQTVRSKFSGKKQRK